MVRSAQRGVQDGRLVCRCQRNTLRRRARSSGRRRLSFAGWAHDEVRGDGVRRLRRAAGGAVRVAGVVGSCSPTFKFWASRRSAAWTPCARASGAPLGRAARMSGCGIRTHCVFGETRIRDAPGAALTGSVPVDVRGNGRNGCGRERARPVWVLGANRGGAATEIKEDFMQRTSRLRRGPAGRQLAVRESAAGDALPARPRPPTGLRNGCRPRR